MLKKNFKRGFTLAEILVTLGIIGVVAAISMPTLITNVQRKTYVTQLHKVYSDIANVMTKYMSDEKVESMLETDLKAGITRPEEFLKKYFNVVKYCGIDDTSCFASSYTGLNSAATNYPIEQLANLYKASLASGASIGFTPHYNLKCYNKANPSEPGVFCMFALVDINGLKAPNRMGRDMFGLYIYPDGSINDQFSSDLGTSTFSNNCKLGVSWGGCLSKIMLDNWEMNY